MGVKKVSSLVALSVGILFFGVISASAETDYSSVKEKIMDQKEHGQVKILEDYANSHLSRLIKSKTAKSLTQLPKEKNGYSTQDLTGDYTYEIEPNNYPDEADFLPRGDLMLGTFSAEDVDVFQIEVPKNSLIAISGVMPIDSLSDIGFVLTDEYSSYIEEDYLQLDDHQMTAGYYLPAGIYYIYTINIGSYVTEDVYGLAWDILEEGDSQPPSVPLVDRFDDKDTLLTGTAEPYSTVEVELDGVLLGSATADENGQYEIVLPETYPIGTILNVTATDQAGNRSDVSYVTVADSSFTGWITENGKRYHYTNGVRDKGWYFENGKHYFLDSSTGVIKTGWVFIDNKWYFFDRMTGVKKTGWLLDKKWYYLDSNGAMQTGWEKVGTKWYFLNSNGTMATGWVKSGGVWYYLAGSGEMKTGWLKDGGSWYYLAGSGAMKTGWVKSGGSWYYLASSGVMKTGWVKVGTKWYYLYNNGKMAYSTRIGSYRLGADGAWIR